MSSSLLEDLKNIGGKLSLSAGLIIPFSVCIGAGRRRENIPLLYKYDFSLGVTTSSTGWLAHPLTRKTSSIRRGYKNIFFVVVVYEIVLKPCQRLQILVLLLWLSLVSLYIFFHIPTKIILPRFR